MSRDVSDAAGVRRIQGLAVFDPTEDRPSVFGDPSTLPSSWDVPSRGADPGLESSRPRRPPPRVRRRAGGGWWPGLLVFFGIVLGGLALLGRVLR